MPYTTEDWIKAEEIAMRVRNECHGKTDAGYAKMRRVAAYITKQLLDSLGNSATETWSYRYECPVGTGGGSLIMPLHSTESQVRAKIMAEIPECNIIYIASSERTNEAQHRDL